MAQIEAEMLKINFWWLSFLVNLYLYQSCAECAVILRLRHSIPFHSECIFGVWHTPFRGVECMLQHALHSMEWVCLDTLQAHSSIWIFPPSICWQFASTNACISKVTTLKTFYSPNLLKRENSNTGMCLECVQTHSLHGMECMLLHTFHSMEWNIQCILHSWSVPGMECVPLRNGHKTGWESLLFQLYVAFSQYNDYL